MSNQQQGSGQTEAERKAAEKAAAAEKAEQERQAAAKSDDGVQLQRGDEVVTAYRPTTITRLKSEGWKPVEDSKGGKA